MQGGSAGALPALLPPPRKREPPGRAAGGIADRPQVAKAPSTLRAFGTSRNAPGVSSPPQPASDNRYRAALSVQVASGATNCTDRAAFPTASLPACGASLSPWAPRSAATGSGREGRSPGLVHSETSDSGTYSGASSPSSLPRFAWPPAPARAVNHPARSWSETRFPAPCRGRKPLLDT